MIRKIALGAALIIGSASGALAWNNIGEIETPSTYVQAPAGHNAYASAVRHVKPVQQPSNLTFDPARASNY